MPVVASGADVLKGLAYGKVRLGRPFAHASVAIQLSNVFDHLNDLLFGKSALAGLASFCSRMRQTLGRNLKGRDSIVTEK